MRSTTIGFVIFVACAANLFALAAAGECASNLDEAPSIPPQAIALDLATGNRKAQAARSMVEAGVAKAMEDLGAHEEGVFVSSSKIAEHAELHPLATYRFLRFLSSLSDAGLCLESTETPGSFALGPVGRFLTPNHPQSVASVVQWEASITSALLWDNLPQFLKTNKPVLTEALGTDDLWSFFASKPAVLATFSQAMSGYSNEQGVFLSTAKLTPTFDLSEYEVICDLGCAEGRLALALKDRFPNANYILADLPETVAQINASALPENFSIEPVNFLETNLPKADAYILKFIIHDWDDKHSSLILQNIKAANPKATLYIIEFGPMPGPNVPHPAKGFDIHMGLYFGATERTQDEYDALFEANGYERVAIHRMEGGYPMYIQEIRVATK